MITKKQAQDLVNAPLQEVLNAASEINNPNKELELCAIINAKSGGCSENCSFCTQSAFFKTEAPKYPILPYDKVEQGAKFMEAAGVHRYCLVMQGGRLRKADENTLVDYYEQLSESTNMSYCSSVGMIDRNQGERLKKAGLTRYHHNLETSAEFYPKICTTHTHQDRINAIVAAKEAGLEICSGGIVGLGESWNDRFSMIDDIRNLEVESVTFNILNPMPGTPMAGNRRLGEDELLRAISIFKLMLGKTSLRFCAGRQALSYDFQRQALEAGFSAVMVGDYLTLKGNRLEEDVAFMKGAGYTMKMEGGGGNS